jgi:hypothetical protein
MKFQTVEWSRNVARIHSQLKPMRVTHCILPDLPGTDLNQEAFFHDLHNGDEQTDKNDKNNNQKSRIVTIAAGRHPTFLILESFDRALNLAQAQVHR